MSEDVKELLRQAAITISALPVSSQDRPLKMRSAWPEFIQKTHPFMQQKGRKISIVPHPDEIDKASEILDSLNKLSPDRRRLVWARACGVPWAALQLRYHASRTHLNMRYKKALAEFLQIHRRH
jgi:hypothetical protein